MDILNVIKIPYIRYFYFIYKITFLNEFEEINSGINMIDT